MDTVRLTGGGQPVYFNFALPGQVPALSATTGIYSQPMPKDGVYSSFEALLRGTSGAQAATVAIYATNDPHAAGADNTVTGTRNNFPVKCTFGSATVTSLEGLFRADMDGDEVYCTAFPAGTTMTYVSASSATFSNTATSSSAGSLQARFQCGAFWLPDALATITLAGTTRACGGFSTAANWKWVRAQISGLSGTGATVAIIMNN